MQLSIKQKALEKEHRCQPRRTLFAPLLVHLPVFMLATTTIRDACIRSQTFKTHILQSTMGRNQQTPPPSSTGEASQQLIPNMPELTAEQAETAMHLLKMSNETVWASDSALLIQPDPSYTLPMLVGLTLLFNTELSAAVRANFISARSEGQVQPASPVPPTAAAGARSPLIKGTPSAARRNLSTSLPPLNPVRSGATEPKRPSGKISAAAAPSPHATPQPAKETSADSSNTLKAADSKFTPALRLLSVAMIIVACNAPMVSLTPSLPTSEDARIRGL